MKKKLLYKLFALTLSLALVLSLTACGPLIVINQGGGNQETESNTSVSDSQTVTSTEETASSEKVEASTETTKPESNSSKKEQTTSKVTQSESKSNTSSKATSSKSTVNAKITQAKAKKIALKDAGVKSSKIYDYEIELDRDDAKLHYDVSFEVDNKEYEYDIDANTGKILSYKKPKTSSSKTSSSKPSTSTTSSSSNITKAKAKSLALKDAGVKEADIYDFEIELDRDNGVTKYDVSFEVNGRDYDYEIDAQTGKFISIEKPKATTSEAKISKTKAKEIALKDANVKSSEISRYKAELEKDDGIWKYEISFNVGRVEYDYTLDATNGDILESDRDIDD